MITLALALESQGVANGSIKTAAAPYHGAAACLVHSEGGAQSLLQSVPESFPQSFPQSIPLFHLAQSMILLPQQCNEQHKI